jgi:hypothetical protein
MLSSSSPACLSTLSSPTLVSYACVARPRSASTSFTAFALNKPCSFSSPSSLCGPLATPARLLRLILVILARILPRSCKITPPHTRVLARILIHSSSIIHSSSVSSYRTCKNNPPQLNLSDSHLPPRAQRPPHSSLLL